MKKLYKIIKGINKYGRLEIIDFIYKTHPKMNDHEDNGFKLSKKELNDTVKYIIEYMVSHNTQYYTIKRAHNRQDKDMTLYLSHSEIIFEVVSFSQDFLNHLTVDDACIEVHGELPELCTDLATYSYGNGEVIVCPTNENIESFSMFVDQYGDNKYLVES